MRPDGVLPRQSPARGNDFDGSALLQSSCLGCRVPPQASQSLQQGGMFIFDGQECVWSHFDESTSDHADLDVVLGIIDDPSKAENFKSK